MTTRPITWSTSCCGSGWDGCLLQRLQPNNPFHQILDTASTMFLSRLVFCACSRTRVFRPLNQPAFHGAVVPRRPYASAKKQGKSTATFVPGSQQRLTDPAAQAEYSTAESSMRTSVEWYRKECTSVESRASGRVTPALLSPVHVKLPDGTTARLEEVATVGVREGTTLLITVFQEDVRFPSKNVRPGLLCHLPSRSVDPQISRASIVRFQNTRGCSSSIR